MSKKSNIGMLIAISNATYTAYDMALAAAVKEHINKSREENFHAFVREHSRVQWEAHGHATRLLAQAYRDEGFTGPIAAEADARKRGLEHAHALAMFWT